jgi:hypothetical protein
MGRALVPAAMAAAMLAFAVAALAAGLTPSWPAAWRGAVQLAILGGIIPMIFAVNLRIVPVFARRAWPGEAWPRAQMALSIAGAWAVFAGIIAGLDGVAIAGNALALAGGILFVVNIGRLFRQPVTMPAPPLPYPGQTEVDAIATWFMRLASVYLLFGLTAGLAMNFWRLGSGRWDLVWAHAMLVGFFLSMVSGVCYHVLARWTGRPWRAIAPIRIHLVVLALGLPAMLHALATNEMTLFAIAGPLQALAIGLLLLNITPMVPALPGLTRPAFAGAMLLLLAGVTLGTLFALDPVLGARLRMVHAEINLFGWSGLLISGAGYYLAPRFAGQPLRWPRLAPTQLAVLTIGIVLGALALAWRGYGHGPAALLLAAQTPVAAGYLLFGALVVGTFRPRKPGAGTVAALPMVTRPAMGAGPR